MTESASESILTVMPSLKVAKAKNILFVGDMSFDRYIRQTAESQGEDYLFSCIDDLLRTADVVVGNLEGPITPHPSVSKGSVIGSPQNFTFTFPPSTASLLARHNVGIVNIGNNHAGDFGWDGVRSTRKHLAEAGVGYFGGLGGDEPVYRMEDISFVSYNEFGGQEPEEAAALVAAESAAGQTVIVYTHWGIEYSQSVAGIREAATLFIKNGADAVFGSHPHVIIPREDISGVPVYFSLGNFIFDQYWNAEVSTGLAVMLEVTGEAVQAEEHRVTTLRDGRTCLASGSSS